MSKQGMKRPERTHTKPRNTQPAVPALQGKIKSGKKPANPIIAGTHAPSQKVFHKEERPISSAYAAIDNDLARDNIENDWDMTAADLQDL